jgi:CheY-like chemotaxis protein
MPPLEQKPGAGERVIVLDDDPDTREPYAEFLRLGGFLVEELGLAQSALESMMLAMPAVVVMDINFAQGMDGYEAARRFRALPGGREVRLVAMTGNLRSRVQKEGPLFDAILTKPAEPDELVAIVRRFAAERLAT